MSQDPNLTIVELTAAALGDLMDELVLVGGCAVGLLVTDSARPPVRQTIDVDLLVEVAPTAKYYEFCERLYAAGFTVKPTESVICRMTKGALVIDVLPTDGTVIGFTNVWYAAAARSAESYRLPSGRDIRLISPPCFLATKLEAFADRGGGDYAHHDIEDIVTVIDGRASIVDDVQNADSDVRGFLLGEFDDLLADPTFIDRISWHLGPHESNDRKEIVIERMRTIAGL